MNTMCTTPLYVTSTDYAATRISIQLYYSSTVHFKEQRLTYLSLQYCIKRFAHLRSSLEHLEAADLVRKHPPISVVVHVIKPPRTSMIIISTQYFKIACTGAIAITLKSPVDMSTFNILHSRIRRYKRIQS